MKYKITLIPGDGIGPEVTDATKHCLNVLGIDIDWQIKQAGETALNTCGSLLPDDTIQSIRETKIALKGPITTPVGKGFRSINVALRQIFDLYVCLRPLKSFNIPHVHHKNIDIVIMRENTEDLYMGVEFPANDPKTKDLINKINSLSEKKVNEESAITIKPITRSGSERLARFAFDYAVKNGRRKVTCVHKANIMKFTDGLFLKTFYEVAEGYRGKIVFDDAIVDNLSMQLVSKPSNFDILMLPNLYGDIISDLGAGLIGGLGLAAGANIGKDIAIFEPTHGSAPKYTGKNKVNPMATILSSVLMLKYLGEDKKANILETAVRQVIDEATHVTYDLKKDRDDPSACGTKEMAEAIANKIKKLL